VKEHNIYYILYIITCNKSIVIKFA
jgi:hypothetical protein